MFQMVHFMPKFLLPGIAQPTREIPIFLCKDQNSWPHFFYKRAIVLLDRAVSQTEFHCQISESDITIIIDSSEHIKSVDFLNKLIVENQQSLGEIDALIVIGGGSILNLGTALASQLCKLSDSGISDNHSKQPNFHFILIPTNVLAMADVAYGSLGLLNKDSVKNALRILYDPDSIILDTRYLVDLPLTQKKQGIAECLKHALLQDSSNNANAPRLSDCLRLLSSYSPDVESIFLCIWKTINAKADIIRAINSGNNIAANLLSYGHVDAEPREAASNFQLAHGDAVLLGLAIELLLAGPSDALDKVRAVLPFTPLADIVNKISFDRKVMLEAYRHSAKPRFRADQDHYYVIRLPHVGYFSDIHLRATKIEMHKYNFDTLYEAADKILMDLKQLCSHPKKKFNYAFFNNRKIGVSKSSRAVEPCSANKTAGLRSKL